MAFDIGKSPVHSNVKKLTGKAVKGAFSASPAYSLSKSGFFTGSPERTDSINLLTEEQQSALSTALGISIEQLPELFQFGDISESQPFQAGQGALSSLLQDFDPTSTREAFEQGVAAPARQGFEEQTAPAIAERFAGANAINSSGFQNQIVKGASDLEGNLAGILANMLQTGEFNNKQFQSQGVGQSLQFAAAPEESRSRQRQSLTNLTQLGLGTQQFQPMVRPGKPSQFSQLVSGFANSL